jgi:hypothetical protein
MKKLFIILSLCLLSVYSRAQFGFTASTTGTIVIGASLSMNYTNYVGTLSVSNASQYENGITTNNCAKFEISTNVPWVLKIAANSALFTATGGGASTDMPASIAGIRVNGTSSFLTLSTSQQTLSSGNAGPASATGNTFNTDISINPGFSYSGGNYSLGLVYTLTAQ